MDEKEPLDYPPGKPVAQFSGRTLSEDDFLVATEWVNSKSTNNTDPCLVCGSTHSVVQPSMIPLPGDSYPHIGISSWIYPSIMVVCHNCGFQRYFNAIVMGLEEPYDPTEDVVHG